MINILIMHIIGGNRKDGGLLPNLVKALWGWLMRRWYRQPVQPLYRSFALNPGWIGDPGEDR